MRRFEGKEYVTVIRPNQKRDRHGDRSDDTTTFRAGPCSISYTTAWAPPAEIKKFPVSAVDRDVTLYFKKRPDIGMNDSIELDYNNYRYRVIVVDTYNKRSNGKEMGTAVRITALETES